MTRHTGQTSRGAWTGLIVGCAVLAVSAAAFAQDARYSYYDLATLGGPSSQAMGMNDHGVVVGWADRSSRVDDRRAFVWSGRIRELGTLGSWSEARDVNNEGVVVGLSMTEAGETHAFVHYADVMYDLNELLGPQVVSGGDEPECEAPMRVMFEANAINDRGMIVGCGYAWADDAPHGYLLLPRTVFGSHIQRYSYVDLGRLPDAADCIALDLNEDGEVVGMSGGQAFAWSRFEMTALEPTSHASEARGLNDHDVRVGWMVDRSGRHAMVWADGKVPGLVTPAGWDSKAFDVNAAGEVVGWIRDTVMPPIGPASAAIWIDGEPLDLNHVTRFPTSLQPWIRLERADAIDDGGRIVGYGRRPDGSIRAFLLEPIPRD